MLKAQVAELVSFEDLFGKLKSRAEEYLKTGRYSFDEDGNKPEPFQLRKTARYYGMPIDVGIERLNFEACLEDDFDGQIRLILLLLMEEWEKVAHINGGQILDSKARLKLVGKCSRFIQKGFLAAIREALSNSFRKNGHQPFVVLSQAESSDKQEKSLNGEVI